jgi:hypothetical protein
MRSYITSEYVDLISNPAVSGSAAFGSFGGKKIQYTLDLIEVSWSY